MKQLIIFLSLFLYSAAHAELPCDSFFDGKSIVDRSGTRETLSTDQAVHIVDITALPTNNARVVVGGAEVVASPDSAMRGIHLSADDSITLYVNNLNKIYIDAAENDEGVVWSACR